MYTQWQILINEDVERGETSVLKFYVTVMERLIFIGLKENLDGNMILLKHYFYFYILT